MMSVIELIQNKNKREIYTIHSSRFQSYGRVLFGYDFRELIQYMEEETLIPEMGNCYYPSVLEMEQTVAYKKIRDNLYGGMDIQIGYCNGKNSRLNGLEYHKSSEINIAVTDFILILGNTFDIEKNTYPSEKCEMFYVKKGEGIEMYQTTLHLSPCRVREDGFKDIVVLQRGTNTPLEFKKEKKLLSEESEERLLFMKNKWILAHPERKALIDQGAYPGIIGENIEVFY